MAPEAEGDDRPPQSDERVGSMLSGFQLVSMDGGDKEGRLGDIVEKLFSPRGMPKLS